LCRGHRRRYDDRHAPMVSVKRPAARTPHPHRGRSRPRHVGQPRVRSHRPRAQGAAPDRHAQAEWEMAGGDH
jgi:hypothetical protein